MNTRGLPVNSGEAKRKSNILFLVEDCIAEKDPEAFLSLSDPKFIVSKSGIDQCQSIACAIDAKGIFGDYGRTYKLWIEERVIEGGCGHELNYIDALSAVPGILLKYVVAEDIWAFMHTEPTGILGFHSRMFMVTFKGGAIGLRSMAEKSPGLFMGTSAEKGILEALRVIAEPYAWNPWKRDRSMAKVA